MTESLSKTLIYYNLAEGLGINVERLLFIGTGQFFLASDARNITRTCEKEQVVRTNENYKMFLASKNYLQKHYMHKRITYSECGDSQFLSVLSAES